MKRQFLYNTCTLLLLFGLMTAVVGVHQWVYPVPNIDAAMSGYDPVWADPSISPDPGTRRKIFNPIRRRSSSGKVVLYSFIEEVAKISNCMNSTLNHENFNQYFSTMIESISFVKGADFDQLQIGNGHLLKLGSNIEEEYEDLKVLRFFQNVTGEIFQRKYECATLDLRLSLSEPLNFRKGFAESLIILNSAAMNPNSTGSEQELVKFVNTYGTHFMQRTWLGSKASMEKRFPNKASNESERLKRSQCVATSADSSLGLSTSANDASSIESSFSQEAGKCSQSFSVDYNFPHDFPPEKVVLHEWMNGWDPEMEKSHVPVSFTLQKISTLFLLPSFNTTLENKKPFYTTMNGEAMYRFFENKLKNYCTLLLGRNDCTVKNSGCGFDSTCVQGTECFDTHVAPQSHDSHHCLNPNDYGGVIVAGGNNLLDKVNGTLSDVESIDFYDLPNLPFPIESNTLTAIGTKLYSCGGRVFIRASTYVNKNECYYLDTVASQSWEFYVSLPIHMSRHTAVRVGETIWFVVWGKLYSLSTDLKTVATYSLPFTVSDGHCAVSNASYSYVIGVGLNKSEIWVNTYPSDPSKWSKVVTMQTEVSNHACLWLGSDVIITGGFLYVSSVYEFNTKTESVKTMSPLNTGRHGHQMMVLDGKPAVVGGWNGGNRYLSSIETYDAKENVWKVDSRNLSTSREHFGLAQLNENIN